MAINSSYEIMHISNTCLDGSQTAVLLLPDAVKQFEGRILSLEQAAALHSYVREVDSYSDQTQAPPHAYTYKVGTTFDADDFTGIKIIRCGNATTVEYTVMALHNTLEGGPEYHINSEETPRAKKMKQIITNYLNNHSELNLDINLFM